ncbi:MAG: hypothetical protein ACXIT4_11270 [Erythrobacter sp.]
MNAGLRLRSHTLGLLGLGLCAACSPSGSEGQTGSQGGGQIEKEKIGTIIATIDGTAYSGETLKIPSEGTSTAEFMAFGPVTTLAIQAHDPKADSMMENVFSLDITLAGSDASAAISEARVSYFPQGLSAPFFMNEGYETETRVNVESLSLGAGTAMVAGRFTAKLCRKASAFAEADAGDCIDTEGTFETALGESA